MPREAGAGFEFVNDIVGGTDPREYIKPIEEGIKEAMTTGVLAGYPVDDLTVELYDGSCTDVDSNEMAFKVAGSMAFKDAAHKAGPAFLEPVMRVEVVVPEEYMGDVMGDLNSRRGRIQSMDARGGRESSLRVCRSRRCSGMRRTCGRRPSQATYSMHFDRSEQAPSHVSEEVIARVQGK